MSRRKLASLLLTGTLSLWGFRAYSDEALGTKPGYLIFAPSRVPNQEAVTRRIWAPGLDEGFVPQGLAVAEGDLFLSAYKSADTKVGTGPCRVYRIDPETGEYTGFFDMPPDCGHAGGLAWVGEGLLVVADTRRLYLVDAEKALAAGKAEGPALRSVTLAGELKGSFIAFDGADLWTGVHDKGAAASRLYRLPLSIFDGPVPGGGLAEERALGSIPVPVMAQGAAFDSRGNLWTSSSSSRFGSLYRLDPRTGEPLAQYTTVIGIEGLSFDAAGLLWSVSEAGTRRWLRWSMTYPFIFQLDLNKLR